MSDANTNTKMQSFELDPEKLERQLDLELMMKRVEWKKAKARQQSKRMAAFVFLFFLIAGLVMAFVFFFPRIQERLQSQPSAAQQAEEKS